MAALYLSVLRPEDRIAVKPHASPVFHAIQYLLGNQSLAKLQDFRGFGGAQSCPSRTKDVDDVDTVGLSTGHDAIVVRGKPDTRGFSVIHLRRSAVIALDCVNATRDYVRGKALAAGALVVDPAQLADMTQPLKSLAASAPSGRA